VHYNNGSSVKDAVHRVETGVSGLYDVVAEVRADVDKLKTDLVADVVPEQVKNDVG
jgi:hypothetical protein